MMRKTHTLSFYLLSGLAAIAQTSTSLPITDQRSISGSKLPAPAGHVVKVEFGHGECLSETGYQELFERIAANKRLYGIHSGGTRGAQPMFIWPIQPSAGFSDPGYYTTNFFVDHDPAFNSHLDWNCGARTYDWSSGNHKGTDLILWPYPWKRMAEEVMELVAAAAGTIVDKRDGYFDQECSNVGQTTWNGITIEHSDGSRSIYMHFKNGTITTKNIGESVVEGEYLGKAGSSGSSNWPHLHFEVRDNNNALIDPFGGPCNSLNGNQSWWAAQPQYMEPRINHISTHYSSQEFYQCPVPETTYEQVNFQPGDSLIMRCYYSDLDNNALTSLVIRDPQSNVYVAWDFNSPWSFAATTWGWWYYIVQNTWPTGAYTFEATFNGVTYVRPFTVGMPIGLEEREALGLSLFPNPATGALHVSGPHLYGAQLTILDGSGREVLRVPLKGGPQLVDISGVPVGLYQVVVATEGTFRSGRLVVSR